MYRDMVIDEIRKTAFILAKLLGLKAHGNHKEFSQDFDKVLLEDYNLELETLISLNEEDFKILIESNKYSSDKLNALSQMLYLFAEPFQHNEKTELLLKKVMEIFDVLEHKYHYQSFDNITKRKAIYNYFDIKA
jgi:hypothetical protein